MKKIIGFDLISSKTPLSPVTFIFPLNQLQGEPGINLHLTVAYSKLLFNVKDNFWRKRRKSLIVAIC
jgi:hypothetical protein